MFDLGGYCLDNNVLSGLGLIVVLVMIEVCECVV